MAASSHGSSSADRGSTSRSTSRSTPERPASASATAARVVAVIGSGRHAGSCQASRLIRSGAFTATSALASRPRNTCTSTSGRSSPHPSPVSW
ncbi:hypothetical protein ACFQX7_04990 [Luedemannella flava]